MNVRKFAVILIYLVYVVVGLVAAAQASGDPSQKTTERPFYLMLRYRRSPEDKGGKIRVYPRADAFYLGPRYGKRSLDSINALNAINAINEKTCIYTGVTNLYRCNISRRPALDQD